MEGRGGGATAEEGEEFLDFEEGTRPAVAEEERNGVRARAGLVDEVQGDVVEVGNWDRGFELRKVVESGFGFAPVELFAPVFDESRDFSDGCAEGPLVGPLELVGELGGGKAVLEVVESVVWDGDGVS